MLRPPFFRMRRALAFAASLSLLTAAAAPSVVPQPASLTALEGELALDASVAVTSSPDAGARRAAARFTTLISAWHGLQLPSKAAAKAPRIRFEKQPKAAAPESYRIEATPDGVTISAHDDAGLQHGASTLVQLIDWREGGAVIPAVRIVDAPRFRWRGLMVDSARHYQSAAALRGFIDAMALHKLNVLHWHLTDDQAWRLEIRKYPRLTEVGAWRVPAGAAREDIDPATGKARRYGGAYSQREVRELVRYAAERAITIVPEIDMPGHATAAIAAYPKLAAIEDPPREVPADWGIYPNVYSLEESTFGFVEDVLREVMALFPGRDIHVGGDEVLKDQWLLPHGRERMKQLGLDDPAKVQPYFTQRVGRFLAAHGRRLVGWDEILEPGLQAGAIVMSWRGTKGALEAAQRGFDTVVAAHPILYFDNRQSAREDEPPGRVAIVTADDVRAFEPMPEGLSPEAAGHVIGVQGNLWTEHIRTEARLLVMAFPRAAAVAELGWSPVGAENRESFHGRLGKLLALYPAIGLGEAARMELARREPLPPPDPLRRTSRQLKLCSDAIPIMLEDDAPPEGPRAIFALDIQSPCWIWPAAPLDGIGALRARVGQLPFNFQIGEDVKKIRFPVPRSAAGELEVHLDGCEGEAVARLPLAPALRSNAVTALEAAPLPGVSGNHDLCFRFAQPALEPMWAMDSVELVPR